MLLCINRPIRERLIGGGGVAGVGGAEGKVRGDGIDLGGLGWVVDGCVVVVVGGCGTGGNGWSGLSVVVLTSELSDTLGGGAVDVQLVGNGEGCSGWFDGGEGGVDGGCSICCCRTGEILFELFLLQRACRLCSTGFRCGAAVKVGGHFLGCVGRGVGWFGVRKGFGVDDIGIFSSEWRIACKSS